MNWTDIFVRGIVVAVAGLVCLLILRAARHAGKTEAELRAALAGEKTKAEIVEKSNEAVQAADTRRASDGDRVAPDVVRGDALPDWLKR
jgi:plasmid stability protein